MVYNFDSSLTFMLNYEEFVNIDLEYVCMLKDSIWRTENRWMLKSETQIKSIITIRNKQFIAKSK